jgi:hypothetical protein
LFDNKWNEFDHPGLKQNQKFVEMENFELGENQNETR